MSTPSKPFGDLDLHGYVDGQIDAGRVASFKQMLSSNPDARERLEGWRRQNEALRSMFASVVFEAVPPRLLPKPLIKPKASAGPTPVSKLGGGVSGTGGGSEPSRGRGFVPALAGTALAAFALGLGVSFAGADLGFGGRAFMNSRSVDLAARPSAALGFALRAAETHQTFATDLNRPVEIPASDEAHLVKWIQHRLAMPIRIPDLKPQGWNLLGGRVVPGELGPAAFLVYGNGVERLGLYVARTNASQGEGFSTYEAGAGTGSVAYWVDEPFGYALTTGRGSNWLDRNGPSLYRSVRAQTRDNASAF